MVVAINGECSFEEGMYAISSNHDPGPTHLIPMPISVHNPGTPLIYFVFFADNRFRVSKLPSGVEKFDMSIVG